MSDSTKYFAAAARFFPEFDRFEVEGLVEAFQQFDKNGSGLIPTSELRPLMEWMGQNPSNKDLELFRKQMEVDKNGGLDWNTFLALMRFLDPTKALAFAHNWIAPALEKFPEFSHDDLLKFAEVYRLFDDDGSGTISVNELIEVFKVHGSPITRDEACDLFRIAGVDPDADDLSWIQYLAVQRHLNPLKMMEFKQKWYAPATKFPHWCRAEIDVFIQVFRDFDMDDNGTIDRNELEFALLNMGMGASKARVSELLAKYANESGVIEWPQFLSMMDSFYPGQRTDFEKLFLEPAKKFSSIFTQEDIDSLILTFQEFDDDADRALSIRGLGQLLTDMGQGCSPQKLAQLMDDFDADRSGTIDFEEFLNIIGSFYGFQPEIKPKAAPVPLPKPVVTAAPAKAATPAPAPVASPAKPAPAPVAAAPKPVASPTPAPSTGSRIAAPAATSSPASGSKIGGNGCPGCGKTVYAAEKMTGLNNEWWHKLCFKCAKCSTALTAGNWQDNGGKIYCKKCYGLHFANQGYGAGRVASFQS